MNKKVFILAFIFTVLSVLVNAASVSAIARTGTCLFVDTRYNHDCDSGLYCKPLPGQTQTGTCEPTITRSNVCDPNDRLTNHGCDPNLYCQLTSSGRAGTCEPTPTTPKIRAGGTCNPGFPNPCVDDYSCRQDPTPGSDLYTCQPVITQANPPGPGGGGEFANIFGKIQLPDPLRGLLSRDATGAGGISMFLSNLVALFYSVAAIVLIFMLLWGAFEWMTSGGEKEKIESARRRIISAIIGITLFAVAFAVIQILGQFTGFKFFVGQK